MDDRLRKMKRIQEVQTRLHQVAEQNLIRAAARAGWT